MPPVYYKLLCCFFRFLLLLIAVYIYLLLVEMKMNDIDSLIFC